MQTSLNLTAHVAPSYPTSWATAVWPTWHHSHHALMDTFSLQSTVTPVFLQLTSHILHMLRHFTCPCVKSDYLFSFLCVCISHIIVVIGRNAITASAENTGGSARVPADVALEGFHCHLLLVLRKLQPKLRPLYEMSCFLASSLPLGFHVSVCQNNFKICHERDF